VGRSLLVAADAVLIAAAFYLAFWVRFEGHVPADRLRQWWHSLPILLVLRIGLHAGLGLHRWSFRLPGLHEARRLVEVSALGSAAFVTVFYFLQRATEDIRLGPPRSVIVLEFLLSTSLLGLLRFWPRLARSWSADRRARADGRRRTLIVGAGNAGDLLMRDLQHSPDHPYRVLGFVDDDPARRGSSLGGRPVLGTLEDLPALCRAHDVSQLLFAIPSLPAPRLREVLTACRGLRLHYKLLPLSVAYLQDRRSTSVLQDLRPEDLLARSAVRFAPEAAAALVTGRRVLVTGAGGSIGSEIARQVATHGAGAVVLLDVAESPLYLLARELEAHHPSLAVAAELVDVRDAPRLRAAFLRHRPQDVFHAAARKHVPLMEAQPEEAVRTNVTGCRLAVEAASEAGAERFVLISTAKAVRPAGAMGASKRLAELVVREQAARARTRFTAVRFGNVLGSSGSVVPLFKAQVEAGGPVTVSDAGCRRYLMTVAEAVGMVVEAGLSGYGDLCVLDMGEPIRILDLARMMIALSGHAEDEIGIVFTGLRPGEKLEEELLAPEEATRARWARDAVRALDAPPPPAAFRERLRRLEEAAEGGDRETVVALMGELVPDYAAARGAVSAPALAAR
jgi:FlaA1/EpsC-like NDP-sugar epimerase